MTDRKANRSGYKNTAVGWIPNDWECVRLGSVFTQSKKKGKKGLPVLSVTTDRGVIPRSQIDRKMADDVSPDQSLLVEPGDLAYNMMRMWQGAVGVCGTSGVISPAYVVCRPLKTRVDPWYMVHLFKSHPGRHWLTSYSYGIHEDRLRLYYDGFALIQMPLPPLAEQHKIAAILSTWETAIEETRALIAATKRRKKALQHELVLGKKRLPNFRDQWRMLALSMVSTVNSSGVDKRTITGETPVQLCNYTDVYYNDIITAKMTFMSATATSSEIKQYQLMKGDVLLTKDSETPDDIAKCAVVAEDLPTVLCGYHLALLRPTSVADGAFLCQLLNTQEVRLAFSRFANGVTRFGISSAAFDHICIRLPPLIEQHAIASILTTADDEIRQLEAKAEALERQKKGLMQKLLAGEVRVTP